MFKKKGQKRNLRQKRGSESDTEQEQSSLLKESQTVSQQQSVVVSSSQNSNGTTDENKSSDLPSAPSAASLLSFDDQEDEDGEVFQVKKSSHSRRLEKFKKKMRQQQKQEETQLFDGRQTSSAKLDRNRQSPDSTVKTEFSNDKVRIAEADSSTASYIPEEDFEILDEYRSRTKENAPTTGIPKFKLEEGAIPDANMVFMARKQRQRARDGGDFVPLDKTKTYKNEKSRLVREDENDDSGGEEGGQFYSRKKLMALEEEERRNVQSEFLDQEQGESDNERDEEFDRWEQEQIRKGVSAQQISTAQQEYNAYYAQHYAMYGTLGMSFDPLPVSEESKNPEPMDLDVEMLPTKATVLKLGGGPAVEKKSGATSLDEILQKMKTRFQSAEDMNRSRQLEVEKLDDHLTENEASLQRLELLIPKLRDQYSLFQEHRSYGRDLLDCLNEKVPEINDIESKMYALWSNRAEFFKKRRKQDIQDQYDELSIAAAGNKKRLQEDADKMMRIAEREARRTRRRQARENTVAGISHHDGVSSDEEETPSRVATYTTEKDKLTEAAELVFKDVLEEFYDVSEVCGRFADWIRKDESSFNEAFISVCMTKLIDPLVRLQLVTWNPLEENCRSLTEMQWYDDALLFAAPVVQPPDAKSLRLEDNEAVYNLLPELVEKVICPKLTALVEKVWDPTSQSQTQRLAGRLKKMVERYPTLTAESKPVQRLLAAIQLQAEETCKDGVFLPLNLMMNKSSDNAMAAAKVFYDRQFWGAVKIMSNLISLEGFLSTESVQTLVLDGVVNRHLVIALQCDTFSESSLLAKCKAIANAVPSSWVSTKSSKPIALLEPFCKVICRVAETSWKENRNRDNLKDLHRILLKLGAKRMAEDLADQLSVKL